MSPAKLVSLRLPPVSMDTSRTRKIFLHPLSADSIAIEACGKPVKVEPIPAALPCKRGRLHKGKVRPAKTTRLERHTLAIRLEAMLADLPHTCYVGSVCNRPGFQIQLNWLQAAHGRGGRHDFDLGGADLGRRA